MTKSVTRYLYVGMATTQVKLPRGRRQYSVPVEILIKLPDQGQGTGGQNPFELAVEALDNNLKSGIISILTETLITEGTLAKYQRSIKLWSLVIKRADRFTGEYVYDGDDALSLLNGLSIPVPMGSGSNPLGLPDLSQDPSLPREVRDLMRDSDSVSLPRGFARGTRLEGSVQGEEINIGVRGQLQGYSGIPFESEIRAQRIPPEALVRS